MLKKSHHTFVGQGLDFSLSALWCKVSGSSCLGIREAFSKFSKTIWMKPTKHPNIIEDSGIYQ
jgi:hypothetical protein